MVDMQVVGIAVAFLLLLLFAVRRHNGKNHTSLYEAALATQEEFLLNFRDVGGKECREIAPTTPRGSEKGDCERGRSTLGNPIGRVRKGLYMRSAWPGWCSQQAFQELATAQNIAVVVDIRSSTERDETYEYEHGIRELFPDSDHTEPPFPDQTRVHIPYVRRRNVVRWVSPQLGVLTKLRFLWHKLINTPEYIAWTPLMERFHVDTEGLAPIYVMFFETSGAEIANVFRTLLSCAEQGKGSLIHCMAGKDRTGITTGLLLMLLGVNDEEIIADYALSQVRFDEAPEVHNALRENAAFMYGAKAGRSFMSSHPDYMRKFISHINLKYSGIAACLNSKGFTHEEQQKLRSLYIEPDESMV